MSNSSLLCKKQVTWQEKTVRSTLLGDNELLTKSYGLSGSSGVWPRLFCLSTKVDLQEAHSAHHAQSRSLMQLQQDHDRFVAAGTAIQSAKQLNSAIHPALLPIEIEDICILVLHLDLGTFPWLFEAMLRDAEDLDFELTRSNITLSSSNQSFEIAAAKHKILLQEKVAHTDTSNLASGFENRLHWV